MDSIAQAFQSIGSNGPSGSSGWLSSILPALGIGTSVAGTVGNIQANQKRNQLLNTEIGQMNNLSNLTLPQVSSGIAALQQPLSSSLVHGVGNAVQANAAERGLSQAPGIYDQMLAQTLAPYQLQEQQLAQQAFFQKLGLPISARPSPFQPLPTTTNSSQMWQAIMNRFLGQGGQPSTPSGSFNYWAANNASPIVPLASNPGDLTPPDLSGLLNMFTGGGGGAGFDLAGAGG